MDLRDYIKVLLRRRRLVGLLLLLGIGASVALTLLATPVYRAETQVFVSLRDTGSGTTSNAYQGNLFSQERVKSYAKIADSPAVTSAVVEKLKLPVTPNELARSITASVPTDTVLVDITVSDPSAARARDVANAAAAQFAVVVSNLERPAAGERSPVSVTVVRPADLPGSPVSPRPLLNIALGLLLGLAAGLGAAVLLETLDTSVKSGDDLQKLTGSSALGIIGYDPQAQRNPLVSHQDARSARGESFRTLRTNLRFVDVDHPPHLVVVTSSVAGEGKSTTACNLAVTLSSAGVRVALVEADLRRPRVAEYMGLEGAVGLTDVLIGRVQLDDVLQRWGDSTLLVLASGPLPPNPSELLGSEQMAETLTALREHVDVVLIDAPPLLPVTDAAVLVSHCDGAILIVRQGKTRREQVSRALEALQSVGARMLGTVLNMAPTSGPNSYGYGYGYGYQSDDTGSTGRSTLAATEQARTVVSGHATSRAS